MRIQITRTGGFAGMTLQAEVDTSRLEADKAAEVEALVGAAAFFSLPARIQSQETRYDGFQYEIRVEDPLRSHEVACDEAGMSRALEELVRRVLRLSRRDRI